MCGIAGIVSRTQIHGLTKIGGAMVQKLRHRGPDNQSIWVNEEENVLLAHTRLAIQDIGVRAKQPMWTADGRLGLVFNGEIYNFKTLRTELTHAGHFFKTTSDTEVLLAAVMQWGVCEAARKCQGMFSFAIFNTSTTTLSLCRDRFGIKPCYWIWNGRILAFASEIKAILAGTSTQYAINSIAVEALLNYNFCRSPDTIFREIKQLEPGEILHLGPSGEPHLESYWNLGEELIRASRTEPSFMQEEEFNIIWSNVIRDFLTADVAVGCFLSGGVDSTMVASAAARITSRGRLKTFSVGYQETNWDESIEAHTIANLLGTDHHTLILSSRNALDLVTQLPDIYDEPFADFSQVPTLALSKFAREHVSVCLSGDGGDELFGGYERYAWVQMMWRKFSLSTPLQRYALIRMLDSKPLNSLSLDSYKEIRVPRTGLAKYINSKEFTSLSFKEFYEKIMSNGNRFLTRFSTTHSVPALCRNFDMPILSQMQYMDIRSYMGDGILTKIDRASMSVGLEVRIPMLDDRIVNYAFKLPADLKVFSDETRVFQKKFARNQAGCESLGRRKRGFGFPVDEWLRGPLREWADELLRSKSLQEVKFLREDKVRKIWFSHLAGNRDEHWRLWPILMYVQWFQHWKGRISDSG